MPLPRAASFRSRTNFVAALTSELGAPLLRVVAGASVRRREAGPQQWRRGLLLGANHIGDLLYLSTPLLALKQALPECVWDIAAPAPGAEVLTPHPAIGDCLALPHERTLAEQRAWAASSRGRGPYDVALCYNRGGHVKDLWLAVQLGIPARVGFVHKGFSGWVTRPLPDPGRLPHAEVFGDAVASLTGVARAGEVRPVVFADASDETDAARVAGETGLEDGQRALAVFCGTRQTQSVTWPAERFAEVARACAAKGWRVVLCGSSDEREGLEALSGGRLPVMAGRLGLRALVCFLRRFDAVLCPDSGPRHLANAAGVPVYFFRNLGAGRNETGAALSTETDLVKGDGEYLNIPAQRRELDRIESGDVAERLLNALI